MCRMVKFLLMVQICIEFDDVDGKRYKAVFSPYQAIKVTTEDCVDCMDVERFLKSESLSSGRYQRHILEVENSEWVKQLKKNLKENDDGATFMDSARHFILDLRDDLVEIIAQNFELSLA